MPHWQVWPHPVFLAHLFLLSSHCFTARLPSLPNRSLWQRPCLVYSAAEESNISRSVLPSCLCTEGASPCHRGSMLLPSSVKFNTIISRILELNGSSVGLVNAIGLCVLTNMIPHSIAISLTTPSWKYTPCSLHIATVMSFSRCAMHCSPCKRLKANSAQFHITSHN